VVDVYVFTRTPADARTTRSVDGSTEPPDIRFLQLLRCGAPLDNTWQPVMGHVHAGETSVRCALREMHEELGLAPDDPDLLGLWALEQVHPFYIAAIDTIVLSPRFCAEVRPGWSPTLNHEHTAHRWVRGADIDRDFMWPGQKACCREILREIVADDSLGRDRLRIPLP
jgi:dATP pyrophosphohydrolase